MQRLRRRVSTVGVIIAALLVGYLGSEAFKDRQFARAEADVKAARDKLATAHDLMTVFKDVGRAVEPSVVSINVRKAVKKPLAHPPMDDDMLRRFFPDGDVPDNLNDGGSFDQIGTGSGVIIEADGGKVYVLTNNHVAGGAEEMIITLWDGREITNGKLVGADAKTDLAVVKMEVDRVIPAKWGDSDKLEKGDWIMAFGSPFGYVGSMTHGIVSALNRQAGLLGAQGYENFIQVDAPINPGNSGGPLVNLEGQVVGINTAIASRNGGFQGIGFAIPSNQAQFVYAALKGKGKVTRGWLGIGINDVAKEKAETANLGYKGDEGILVKEIFKGTPAAGKLQPGDVITKINGKPVSNTQALRNVVAAMPPGSEIKLEIFREGKTQETTVKLGEQPDDLSAIGQAMPPKLPGNDKDLAADTLGLRVADLTPELATRYGLADEKEGALVTRVEPRSPVARLLKPGDLITRIANQNVKGADDLLKALKDQDLKKGIRMTIQSREGSRSIFVQVDKRTE